jgi:hypothetical protein
VRSILIGLLLLCIALSAACSQKPAQAAITKLAFGNNDAAEPQTNSFEVDKVIYVVATVANAVGPHNLNFEVTVDSNVENKVQGDHIMNKSIDFEGKQPLFLHFSIAYPGNYKIEATLTDQNGKQLDTKAGIITVTGEAKPPEEKERGLKDRDRGQDRESDKDRDRDRGKDKDRK